jgi:hypothetical protein
MGLVSTSLTVHSDFLLFSFAAQVVLDLANAHPPGGDLVGPLGYVADTVSTDAYAAIVVQKGVLRISNVFIMFFSLNSYPPPLTLVPSL